ncbi:MAG TPA: chemotaxis protein CheW [Sphingomonas sp.]|nr:chemotaxis protein CheW [Sphingomonas sp.]
MSGGGDVQAVVFGLGREMFALPVGSVREILDHRDASAIPHGPSWLIGLTDVRDQAVPMVDLRVRLGLAAADVTLATRVLVVDVPIGGRVLTLGLVVDRVLDVSSFAAAEIEETPDIGVRWRSEYIEGVVRRPDGFVVLLATNGIFSSEEDARVLPNVAQAA